MSNLKEKSSSDEVKIVKKNQKLKVKQNLEDKKTLDVKQTLEDNITLKLKDNMTLDILIEIIDQYIEYYNKTIKINDKLTKEAPKHKKIRNINFPSEITENIVKFVIAMNYNVMPNWNTTVGDIQTWEKNNENIIKPLKIEVKGFSTDGASSFGPATKWDKIYFVDAKDFIKKNFEVFEVNLSNEDKEWRKIKFTIGEPIAEDSIEKLPNDLNKLPNSKLQELCRKRGIKCTGKKEQLIHNLMNMQPNEKFPTRTYDELSKEGKRPHGSFHNLLKKQLKDNCKSVFKGNIEELINHFKVKDDLIDNLTSDFTKINIKKDIIV